MLLLEEGLECHEEFPDNILGRYILHGMIACGLR